MHFNSTSTSAHRVTISFVRCNFSTFYKQTTRLSGFDDDWQRLLTICARLADAWTLDFISIRNVHIVAIYVKGKQIYKFASKKSSISGLDHVAEPLLQQALSTADGERDTVLRDSLLRVCGVRALPYYELDAARVDREVGV